MQQTRFLWFVLTPLVHAARRRARALSAAAVVAVVIVAGLAGAAAADPVTIGLDPVADAYVSQQTPNKRYGTLPELRAAGTPIMRSYLRFDLRGVTGTVARATLRVYANGASGVSYDVRGVADTSWQERTITYADAPVVASIVTASSGPFAAGWTSTDVTPLVSGGRLVSLALTSTAVTAISLGSRESANRPQLVVELADTTAPAVTLAVPANGSWTRSTTPTFGGGAGTDAGDADTVFVRIYSGSSTAGAPVDTLSTSRSGNSWSMAASVPLAEGTYTAQAEQSDAAGNVGRSSANTFGVDTTPPVVMLTSPADASLTDDATPTLAGTAGTAPGDAATVAVTIYSGSSASGAPVEILSAVRAGEAWSVDASPALANGTYTARAEQSDAAGNTGVSAPSTFTVAAPPAATGGWARPRARSRRTRR